VLDCMLRAQKRLLLAFNVYFIGTGGANTHPHICQNRMVPKDFQSAAILLRTLHEYSEEYRILYLIFTYTYLT